ncbi:hypothetical protein GCM10009846_27320 [Agrococcus versicolor]|uniref:AAA domain-containing protein n=1 Tax=Agrococcus versicolor TaxID=501482 RepID=A0ABP5MMH1_9MICO
MSDPIVPQTRIRAEIRQDGSGVLDVNGTHRHLERGGFPQTRTAIVSHAAEFAAALRRPIGVSITGADGDWDIVVHPDGSVTDVRQLAPPPSPEPLPTTPPLASAPAPAPAAPASAPSTPAAPVPPAAPSAPPAAPFVASVPSFGQTGSVDRVEDATLASRDDLQDLDDLESTAVRAPEPAAAPSAPAPAAQAEAPAPPQPEPAPEPEAQHGAQELPATHAAQPAPEPQASPALPSFEPSLDDTIASSRLVETAAPKPSPSVPLQAPIESVPGYDPLLDETVARAPAAHRPIASVPSAPAAAPAQPAYQPGQVASTPAPSAYAAPVQQVPQVPQPQIPAMPQAPAEQPAAQQQERQPGYAPGELTGPMTADGRHSFLEASQRDAPAQQGLRGAMTRMGLKMTPSQEELAERADERAVSQHWPGPRTIAVVNGKGGAGKTPTTVLLSAVFAHFGGAGVLAWDNNQTRGTLGWRTERGPHEATLLELLPQAERLLGVGAQSADLASFVHHQSQDKFDVLRSKPMRLAHENRVNPGDVDAIHAVASKYYRLIVIDSGNDESDPMWLRMIDHADQIVVATTTRADHAEAGALLLEALAQRDERSAILAKRSVVVVSQADPKASRQDVDGVIGGYGPLAREVVRIPFDQGLVDGHLRLGALRPETRRAWLGAAAAVARGL